MRYRIWINIGRGFSAALLGGMMLLPSPAFAGGGSPAPKSIKILGQTARKAGETEVGGVTMAIYGDLPAGARVDYLRAMRTGNDVTLYLLLRDAAQEPLAVRMQNFEPHAVMAQVGKSLIPASYMGIAESGSGEGVSGTLPAGSKAPAKVRFSSIPADVKTIPCIYLNMSGHPEMDARNCFFTYALYNVPVMSVGEREVQELYGPVSKVTITDGEGNLQADYNFTPEGKLVAKPGEDEGKKTFDANGMLTGVDNAKQDFEVKYIYDNTGHLAKSLTTNADYDSVTDYIYERNDPYELLTQAVTTYDNGEKSIMKCRDYSIDAYGNWVRRSVYFDDNPTPMVQVRKITYFGF